MFTSEQLFGEVETSDLLRHSVFLERAKAQDERGEAFVRLGLGAYLVARLVDAYLLNLSGRLECDGFRWQLNAVRQHAAGLPGDVPETSHLLGIADAIAQDQATPQTLRIGLTAYAYFLEHEGRYAEALEVLSLATRTHAGPVPTGDFAASALFVARLNRKLARWERATACYGLAVTAGEILGDHVTRLRGCLGRGAVCRGQGNLPMARSIAETALEEAKALDLVEVQVIAYSDLSAVYELQGQKLEALEADYQAFLITPDATERMRVLGHVGIGLLQVGALSAARLAFNIVIRSNASFWTRTNALIELMDLESTDGNRVAFERFRALAEAERNRMSPSMVADYLHKSGLGFARFGQLNRAREVFGKALSVAEAHRLNVWYFRIEASIQGLEKQEQQQQRAAEVSEAGASVSDTSFSDTSVVLEMEAGLREYAALQPA